MHSRQKFMANISEKPYFLAGYNIDSRAQQVCYQIIWLTSWVFKCLGISEFQQHFHHGY